MRIARFSRRTFGLLCLAVCAPSLAGSALPEPHGFPLPVDQSRSTTARHLAKPVLRSKTLDLMESAESWQHFGPGKMQLSSERKKEGRYSLELTSPTKGTEPPRVEGRPFGEAGVRLKVPQSDWSDFNRLSVWVYPDLPGFKVVSMLLKLQSEGTEGRSYTDGGLHFVLLQNKRWNQVVWEIEHLERKQVRGVELIYRLQGNENGATTNVAYYFDQLELQAVEPDHFIGWPVAGGKIALNHLGFEPDGKKVAISPVLAEESFTITDARSRQKVWSGKPRRTTLNEQPFAVLDFSAFTNAGLYVVGYGTNTSFAFPVSADPLRPALIAGLNFFYCERCGDAVKGIHDVCHEDWQVQHDGKKLKINGGWHDAGDLSQGLVNTSEAAWSMLRLAERIRKSDPALAARFVDEARWGAEWLLKARFAGGYRVTWATMDFWTDGEPGNVDDVTVRAGNSAFDNFIAASAEAAAARAFAATAPDLASRCKAAAIEDFDFALGQLKNWAMEPVAAGAQAGVELYKLTSEPKYSELAVRFASFILGCQQKEKPDWEIPLTGFFYTSTNRQRVLHYNHRSHEQAPVMALADLADLFPDHAGAPAWREGVKQYGDYLLQASRVTGPYHMIPAGIYRLADTQDAEQRKQISQGVRLAEGIYLRRFPVWGDFRGNLGVQLSQATAAARAARLLNSPDLRRLAQEQIEWTLGRNPFAQSLMYGIGYNYAPQYTAMSGDITGSLPVGIQSRLHGDEPYWPTANCYNYAEVWVHPVSRFFTTCAELSAP